MGRVSAYFWAERGDRSGGAAPCRRCGSRAALPWRQSHPM